jgi:hypothetical protein
LPQPNSALLTAEGAENAEVAQRMSFPLLCLYALCAYAVKEELIKCLTNLLPRKTRNHGCALQSSASGSHQLD